MRAAILGLTVVLTLGGLAAACENSSYTEIDEAQVEEILAITDRPTFNLITGQFPHHSPEYWQSQIDRSDRELNQLRQVTSINDKGVGQMKLGHYDLAASSFHAALRMQPNYYPALSNLGVLEKKRGNFRAAANWIRLALKIKPGGHMGLGDYYQLMCRWRAENETTPPYRNFLGQSYGNLHAPQGRHSPALEMLYLRTLIQNDRAFPDVYLVLGDRLQRRGHHHLALWAYLRAEQLQHPAARVVKQRVLLAYSDLQAQMRRLGRRHLGGLTVFTNAIRKGLVEAEAWVRAFERAEARLVAQSSRRPTFRQVEHVLRREKTQRVVPFDVLRPRERESKANALRRTTTG